MTTSALISDDLNFVSDDLTSADDDLKKHSVRLLISDNLRYLAFKKKWGQRCNSAPCSLICNI